MRIAMSWLLKVGRLNILLKQKGIDIGTVGPIPPPISSQAPLAALLSRLAAYHHCVVNISCTRSLLIKLTTSANQSTVVSQSDVIKFLASHITSYTPQVRYGTVSSDLTNVHPTP